MAAEQPSTWMRSILGARSTSRTPAATFPLRCDDLCIEDIAITIDTMDLGGRKQTTFHDSGIRIRWRHEADVLYISQYPFSTSEGSHLVLSFHKSEHVITAPKGCTDPELVASQIRIVVNKPITPVIAFDNEDHIADRQCSTANAKSWCSIPFTTLCAGTVLTLFIQAASPQQAGFDQLVRLLEQPPKTSMVLSRKPTTDREPAIIFKIQELLEDVRIERNAEKTERNSWEHDPAVHTTDAVNTSGRIAGIVEPALQQIQRAALDRPHSAESSSPQCMWLDLRLTDQSVFASSTPDTVNDPKDNSSCPKARQEQRTSGRSFGRRQRRHQTRSARNANNSSGDATQNGQRHNLNLRSQQARLQASDLWPEKAALTKWRQFATTKNSQAHDGVSETARPWFKISADFGGLDSRKTQEMSSDKYPLDASGISRRRESLWPSPVESVVESNWIHNDTNEGVETAQPPVRKRRGGALFYIP